MKESPRQAFRWAPHASGVTIAKPKDYEECREEFEAPSAYSLWETMRLTPTALQPGDILELPAGGLRIFKYVGFEEAKWLVPDAKAPDGPVPETVAQAG